MACITYMILLEGRGEKLGENKVVIFEGIYDSHMLLVFVLGGEIIRYYLSTFLDGEAS